METSKKVGAGFKHAIIFDNPENYAARHSRQQHLDDLLSLQEYRRFELDIAEDIFGIAGNTLPVEDIYSKPAAQSTDPNWVLYAISKCFSPSPAPDHQNGEMNIEIRVMMEVPHLLSWLIECGFVSQSSLRLGISTEGGRDPFPQGAIPLALVEADPSFFWLEKLVLHSSALDSSDMAAIIKECIFGAFELSVQHTGTKTKGTELANPDNTFKKKGQVPVDDALALSDGGKQKKQRQHQILMTTLKKLSDKPRKAVISAIRPFLLGEELFALVQFLRQQLFAAGYTTSFRAQAIMTPPQTPELPPSSKAAVSHQVLDLEVIVSLLSCCIDCLGPSAALGGDNSAIQTLITDLRSEISSTLEGVEEAAYLRGILREVWRYGASGTESYTDSALVGEPRSGDIITLFSQTSEEQFDTTTGSGMLPLSLKADGKVGHSRKPGRERAGAVSRAVGKYSFERLVL